jgi:polysaccharide export outer membrane protein
MIFNMAQRGFSLAFVVICLGLAGCGALGGGSSTAESAPPPAPAVTGAADTIRPGDKITVRLTGVPDDGYMNEIEVSPSGQISVPLIAQPFQAAGLLPADLANNIMTAYRQQRIYSNPNVVVLAEERFVNVGGDVRTPSRVPFTPDLTLLSAINFCGGFTEYANRRDIHIVRGSQVITVNGARAQSVPGADPQLYPGDQINVPRTIF